MIISLAQFLLSVFQHFLEVGLYFLNYYKMKEETSIWDDLKIISILGIVATLGLMFVIDTFMFRLTWVLAAALFWNTFCTIAIMYSADKTKVNKKWVLATGIVFGFPIAALKIIIRQMR